MSFWGFISATLSLKLIVDISEQYSNTQEHCELCTFNYTDCNIIQPHGVPIFCFRCNNTSESLTGHMFTQPYKPPRMCEVYVLFAFVLSFQSFLPTEVVDEMSPRWEVDLSPNDPVYFEKALISDSALLNKYKEGTKPILAPPSYFDDAAKTLFFIPLNK